ncbi:MAG: phage minor head protein [Pseudomonadota bacterium]
MADLSFDEAVDFLSQKVRLPSETWTDLKQAAHARAFVVAGATKDALIADLHAAVTRAATEGRTKADFLRDFDSIVAKHGWKHRGGRAWRAGVIYSTNMRMAFQAGKWAQIRSLAQTLEKQGRTVYLRYSAILDSHTRPQHRDWHGLILPWDHPFWQTHYPPNDWGCRCTVEVLTDLDLAREGLKPTPPDQVPQVRMEDRPVDTPFGQETWQAPAGVGTGFSYNVGEAWLAGAVPRPLQHPLPPPAVPAVPHNLPPLTPHQVDPARILADNLTDLEYVDAFLAARGSGRCRSGT